jgi:hypothetical protein
VKRLPAILALAALAGCGEGGEVARPARAAPPIPVPSSVVPASTPIMIGADGVRGQNARALILLFGPPRIDIQEGPARKLQFLGTACVLDVYLYPHGRGEPVVTHLDTRLRDGRAVDPASCVATLRRVPLPQ